MHARELVEMAAVIATRASAVITGAADPLLSSGIQQYWKSSRQRFDRWERSLQNLVSFQKIDDQDKPPLHLTKAVVEEILTSEVLTRVWTAVVVASEHSHLTGSDQNMEPVVRSIWSQHLEIRNRALSLILEEKMFDHEGLAQINQLRKRTERWADLLLGQLINPVYDASEFAVDVDRLREFTADARSEHSDGEGHRAWLLTMASLKVCFQKGLSPISPNGDLNSTIAANILASFPTGLFESIGLFQSLWIARMQYIADDAEEMLNRLIETTDQEYSHELILSPPHLNVPPKHFDEQD